MKALVLILPVLLLGACHSHGAAHDSAMVEHAHDSTKDYVKPGIPVTLSAADTVKIRPEQTGTVTVDVSGPSGERVDLSFASKTDLSILSLPVETVILSEAGDANVTVTVSSPTEGRHYLDVQASLQSMSGVRTLSVPVQVGEGGIVGWEKSGETRIGPDGKPMVVMPASETINGQPVESDQIDKN